MARLFSCLCLSAPSFVATAGLCPKEFFNSTQIYEFCAAVEAAGGRWEGLMQRLLLVHLPFATNFEVEIELDRYIEMAMKHYGGT